MANGLIQRYYIKYIQFNCSQSENLSPPRVPPTNHTLVLSCSLLCFCFIGLQYSFVLHIIVAYWPKTCASRRWLLHYGFPGDSVILLGGGFSSLHNIPLRTRNMYIDLTLVFRENLSADVQFFFFWRTPVKVRSNLKFMKHERCRRNQDLLWSFASRINFYL